MKTRIFITVVALLGGTATWAQVHRCAQADGTVVFQDFTCDGHPSPESLRAAEARQAQAQQAAGPQREQERRKTALQAAQSNAHYRRTTQGHARSCMPWHQIRNLETSASSVTLSDKERKTLRQQIEAEKRCHRSK